MPSYKLFYFDGRGRAETVRLIFTQAGVAFEDVRIPREDWPTKFKPNMPTGQVPTLEVDGKRLGQSVAIGRYLAREFGLAGKTAWDQAVVDQLIDGIGDLYSSLRPFMVAKFANDAEKMKTEWEKFKTDAFKKFLDLYTTLLSKNEANSGWFVGSDITWADIAIFDFISSTLTYEPGVLDAYPALKAHSAKVASQPKIAEYLKNRPASTF